MLSSTFLFINRKRVSCPTPSTLRLQHKSIQKNLYVLYYKSRSFSISSFKMVGSSSSSSSSSSDPCACSECALGSAASDSLTKEEMINKVNAYENQIEGRLDHISTNNAVRDVAQKGDHGERLSKEDVKR
jgi:hypothetical protein